MKAEDTVMRTCDLVELRDWNRDSVLLAQAKISFKAGINEVVNFTAREFGVDWSQESAKLEEWGLE